MTVPGSDGISRWPRLSNWRDRLRSEKQLRGLLVTCLAGLVGLLLNQFPLDIWAGIHLLFGGVVTVGVAMALGPIHGGLAALIAYLPTIWLLGHSQALAAAILENVALGLVARRWGEKNLAGVIFWAAVTAPLLSRGLLFGFGYPPVLAWAILLTGPLNCVVNVALAILLLWLTNAFERAGAPGRSEQLRSLRLYLAGGIVVAVVTPLMLVVIGRGKAAEKEMIEQSRTRHSRAAAAVSKDIEHYIIRHREAVASLAATMEQFRVYDTAELDRLLQRYQTVHGNFLELRIADSNGKVLASHPRYTSFGEDSIHLDGDIGGRDFFQKTRTTGHSQISPVFSKKSLGGPSLVAVTAPVHRADGTLTGVVFGSLRLDKFSPLAAELQNNPAERLLIFGSKKELVYASAAAPAGAAEAAMLNAAESRPPGTSFSWPSNDLAETNSLASVAEVPQIGWRVLLISPLASVHLKVSEYYRHAALWTLAALLLSILLAEQVSRLVIHPLDRLVQCVREMAGRPGHTAPVTMIRAAPKEIRDLGRDFETMSASLAQSYQGLRESLDERLRLNDELTRLLLQLKQNAAQLTEAKNHAEDASRAKSAFLANISHEIRTPLNGVMGALGVLQESEIAGEHKQLARMAMESGAALTVLVNNLLSFSAAAGGETVVEQICFRPAEMAESLRAQYGPKVAGKGLQLAVFIDPKAEGRFLGDPGKIRQVWDQLVDNAVKFTNRGQVRLAITFRTESAQAVQLRFEVSDTGIGVPESMQGSIFEPFTQADDSTTRRHGGTGLGLALSKQLVERLGGIIDMQSQKGLGSMFWFQIPLIPEDPIRVLDDPAAKTPKLDPEPADGRPRVLVVEDNPVNQRVACRLLEKAGYYALVAANGRAALDYLAGQSFDAILMDCQMPVMDGYEAAQQIRQMERNGSHIPIIAITAHAMVGDRERCLNAGMDDYLTKPVSREALVMVLKKWIPALAHQPSSQSVA